MPHQKTLTPRKGASPLFSGKLRGIQGRQELAGAANQARRLTGVSPGIQAQARPFAQQARQRGRARGRAQTVLAFELQRKQENDAFRREELRREGIRRDASLITQQRSDQFSRALATKRLTLEEQRAEARGTEFQTQEDRRREEFEARFGEIDPATGERRGGIERERIAQREEAAEGVTERAQAAAQAEVTEDEQKATREAARDRLRIVDDEFERFVDLARDAGVQEEKLTGKESGLVMDSFKANIKRVIRENPEISEDEAVSQALEASRLTGGAATIAESAPVGPTTPRGRARGLTPGAPAAPAQRITAAESQKMVGEAMRDKRITGKIAKKDVTSAAKAIEQGADPEKVFERLNQSGQTQAEPAQPTKPEATVEPEQEITQNQQDIADLEDRLAQLKNIDEGRRKSLEATTPTSIKGTRGRKGVPTFTKRKSGKARTRRSPEEARALKAQIQKNLSRLRKEGTTGTAQQRRARNKALEDQQKLLDQLNRQKTSAAQSRLPSRAR